MAGQRYLLEARGREPNGVGAVDARALGERIGHLALDGMRAIDDALLLVLDLS